jgi:hypothetical protein
MAMLAMAGTQCTSNPSATSSGTSSSNGHGDAGSDHDAGFDTGLPDATIHTDADLPVAEWVPIAGLEMCDGQSLVLPASAWPTRTWTSCGPGCLTAPSVHLSEGITSGTRHSGAATIRGETYLRTAMYTSSYKYHELRRMSDDAVLYVLRFQKNCLVAAGQNGSPLLFQMFESGQPEDGKTDHWVGTFQLDDMKLYPHPGLVSTNPNTLGWLASNDAWAVLNGASVDVALDPMQSALTPIFQGGLPFHGRAYEDMIAWVDWGTWPMPVRSFTRSGGLKTLIQGDWGVAGLGIGEERIALVKVRGPEVFSGLYENATLAWTPRTDDPIGITITDGPSLTGKFTSHAQVGSEGDHIALTVAGDAATGAPSGTFVLQVSTGKFWFIQAPTNSFVTLAALAANEVIVMVTPFKTQVTYFDRYIRYDLSKLDQLGQLVVP